MRKDRLVWSNTSKLNIFSQWTDYGLSGHMVFDHGQIRPAGKMYLKTHIPRESCNNLILWFTLLIWYESCQLWRNDYVMIFLLRNHYVIGRIWVILRNILIILFTISTATSDLHTKHCNYDVVITSSFFYYVIITQQLRY